MITTAKYDRVTEMHVYHRFSKTKNHLVQFPEIFFIRYILGLRGLFKYECK